jgi:hypothetical protein
MSFNSVGSKASQRFEVAHAFVPEKTCYVLAFGRIVIRHCTGTVFDKPLSGLDDRFGKCFLRLDLFSKAGVLLLGCVGFNV